MDFDSQFFIDKLTYSKKDLGARVKQGKTLFKLWAPTAKSVKLNLFKDGFEGSSFANIQMKSLTHGVWSASYECSHGTYYTYSIQTDEGTEEAVDPYAKACGANGLRGMVVDLSLTNPKNFEKDTYVSCPSYEDAIIWETHVRDFSNTIENCKYKGKYLAFTEHGLKNSSGHSVGIDYLVKLGITHVQLQPVFDYGSGDETNTSTWFNWGYDPANYNIPEGSYSTDPYHGEVRIKEFKQMVQAIHKAGIGVIMDVVYNHTFFVNSNLWKTVPYYYYRYKGWQQLSNGSGCGNETASERFMYSKYMLDSILYWQKEYHIDGFRFDLMALHDTDTMNKIEKEVHKVNPNALIYGEPWAGGDSALPYERRAIRDNLGNTSKIFTFNDAIRDGLKGSCFNSKERGLISGNINGDTAGRVAFGVGGIGFVNYMSCHDNLTLWDKLALSCEHTSAEARIKMNKFGAQVIMISKGVPFMLSGEEFLRSKNGDGNSYMSPDSINNLNWNIIQKNSLASSMVETYRKLIQIRKNNPFLHNSKISTSIDANYIITVYYTVKSKVVGVAIINPSANDYIFTSTKTEGYKILFNGDCYKTKPLSKRTRVESKSVLLIKKANCGHGSK